MIRRLSFKYAVIFELREPLSAILYMAYLGSLFWGGFVLFFPSPRRGKYVLQKLCCFTVEQQWLFIFYDPVLQHG